MQPKAAVFLLRIKSLALGVEVMLERTHASGEAARLLMGIS
jgi:hypothetical protein